MHKAPPDVAIYTAAIDRQLSVHGYYLPGLGAAGDRHSGIQQGLQAKSAASPYPISVDSYQKQSMMKPTSIV